MDARITGETTDLDGFPLWDFFLHDDGTTFEVPIIDDGQEDQQQSDVAVYLVRLGVPQLPDVGVDWLGFIGGTTTFGELDAQVRQALADAGHDDFRPEYDILNEILTVVTRRGAV